MTQTIESEYLKMVRAQALYWLKKANDLRVDACQCATTAEFDAGMAESRAASAISAQWVEEERIAARSETGGGKLT
jgi:hypothetical protein